MDWLTVKYINLLSSRLRNFKRKGNNLWNCSCPYCGDSKTNKRKARGYVYDLKGKAQYHCHNCSVTRSFTNFLKEQDYLFYTDFVKESLTEKGIRKSDQHKVTLKTRSDTASKTCNNALDRLKSILVLKKDHPAREYVKSRSIPLEFYNKLYYAPKFNAWTISVVPDKEEALETSREHPRLIIPFLDKEGNLTAFQGRSFDPDDKLRYITIIVDSNAPKIFGIDRYDPNKKGYITEGPLDSLFLENGISSAGGDIAVTLSNSFDRSNLVVVYDNERRSIFTIQKMNKAINAGHPVFFWPSESMGKDINEAINKGLTIDQLKDIIDDNTYSGLSALNQMASWKRVGNVYERNRQ